MRRLWGPVVAFVVSIPFAQVARADETEASADRWYVGFAAAGKLDGMEGVGSGNPLTNTLGYWPVAIEAGYAVTPLLRIHASAAGGFLAGDETFGRIYEFLVGPQVLFGAGKTRLGVRLDGGYSLLSYDWKGEYVSLDAFVLEPKGVLACDVSTHWSFNAQVGPRLKWIADYSGSPQVGFAVGAGFGRRF